MARNNKNDGEQETLKKEEEECSERYDKDNPIDFYNTSTEEFLILLLLLLLLVVVIIIKLIKKTYSLNLFLIIFNSIRIPANNI